MRSDGWPARCVFALGSVVLVATSAPQRWSAQVTRELTLRSSGAGDDKVVHVRVRMSGPLSADLAMVSLDLVGHVDRPASDLTLGWYDGTYDPELDDTGSLQEDDDLYYAGDFQRFSSYHGVWSCAGDGMCERDIEAHLSTGLARPYAVDLTLTLNVSGSREHRPAGSIEIEAEVRDAP